MYFSPLRRKHNVFKWGDEIIYGFAALITYCRPLFYLKFLILLITTSVKSYYNKTNFHVAFC